MGADTKALRQRIRHVDSTLHLTRAMGLVASSKIRRASDAMQKSRAYAAALRDVVGRLAACPTCAKSPYMRQSGEGRTVLLVIAGDRGMCGGYNANVFRLAREYPGATVIPIGKRACDRFGEGYGSSETFTAKDGNDLAVRLCREFVAGEFDRLGILRSRYISVMAEEAVIDWALPLTPGKAAASAGTVFEPDEETVLNEAIPTYVGGLIMAAVRESFACEVTARRMAMDSAGRNAEEMIGHLQLAYNRARQSAITQEITEIVAGSGG